MKTIGPDHFEVFYEALNGYRPFPWQTRLTKRVMKTGKWPDVIDLPTGTGKTSVIDITVFALACFPRRFPRRVLMVIDRRVIVDQAALHANCILRKLANARDGILANVAKGLRSCWNASDDHEPFAVAVLRGGMPKENTWAKRPDIPVIAISTVDQVGSRLLFGGYGVSDSMAPVHAGLLGNDALYFLDEVHLSIPFAETLNAVNNRWRKQMEVPLPDRFAVVQMSATPAPSGPDVTVFSLDAEDRSDTILSSRLRAHKPTALELVKVKGQDEQEKKAIFAKRCVAEAEKFISKGMGTVAIIVNRVETACLAMEALESNQMVDGCLITGRMRPIDRDDVLNEKILERVSSGRIRNRHTEPLVVVATQCIEAGADFDFDAIVTECASLDALRQRFGRLDRRGLLDPLPSSLSVRAVILARSDQVGEKSDDPIYGKAMVKTWRWLLERLDLDMGMAYLELPEPEIAPQLIAPRLSAPVLLPAHLDRWCQTQPKPWPVPDIALWLHGQRQSLPEVQVLWRADVSDDQLKECLSHPERIDALTARLSACPPGSPEAISLPVYSIRGWLERQPAALQDIPDVEGVPMQDGARALESKPGRSAVRWTPNGAEIVHAVDIVPGDTLVVPATYGGLKWHSWSPASTEPVSDLGDIVQWKMRGKATLRLHPSVVPQWMDEYPSLPQVHDESNPDENPGKEVKDWIAAVGARLTPPWDDIVRQIKSGYKRVGLADNTWVLIASKRRMQIQSFENASGIDDEESFVEHEVSLETHCSHVKNYAIRFAEAVGIPQSIVNDIGIAAWLHDVGKSDPRFQKLLAGGSDVRLAMLDKPIAKSRMSSRDRISRMEARSASGYPRGQRHELLSTAMVQQCKDALAKAKDPDLVLYLIQSHHGHCRPFAPPLADPAPVRVSFSHGGLILAADSNHGLARLDSGIVDRFWRMNRKYGWWGIAGLEAILRLADHRASEMEEMLS